MLCRPTIIPLLSAKSEHTLRLHQRRYPKQLPAAVPDASRARRQPITAPVTALAQPPGAVVGDKSYDTSNVLAAIAGQRAGAVIPPEINRLDQRAYARNL
jgi:hypothetical protein